MNNYYETRYTFDADRTKVWRAICQYLQKYIKNGDTVLELGCGYADFINQIRAKRKIAIDINISSKKHCNKDVEFILSSVTSQLSIEEESINAVFASNLLEHLSIEEVKTLLLKIRNMLNYGGRLIIIQPNYKYSYKDYWDDYTHITPFTHISLTDLIGSSGFNIILTKKKFLPFTFKSIFPKSYLLTKIYLALPVKPFAKQMLIIAGKNEN
jgi:ubiquinone/menaquinone biosynthesis C-methylase UbiE